MGGPEQLSRFDSFRVHTACENRPKKGNNLGKYFLKQRAYFKKKIKYIEKIFFKNSNYCTIFPFLSHSDMHKSDLKLVANVSIINFSLFTRRFRVVHTETSLHCVLDSAFWEQKRSKSHDQICQFSLKCHTKDYFGD